MHSEIWNGRQAEHVLENKAKKSQTTVGVHAWARSAWLWVEAVDTRIADISL
jgi:hypothetical protein